MNTIAGAMKIDGHGLASNGDPATGWRGVRRIEAYGNRWTYLGASTWTSFELRGGTNYAFNNYADTSHAGAAGFQLRDYGYLGMYGGFQHRYQTPYNYPLMDQVGRGQDTTVSVTTIADGAYVKIANPGTTTNWGAIGASSSSSGTYFFATGVGSGDGTVTRNSSEPGYIFNNKRNGVAWTRSVQGASASPNYVTNLTGYAPGTTSLTLATVASTLYAQNAVSFSNDATNRYLVTADVVAPGPRTLTISPGLVNSVPASAITVSANPNTLWQYQLGTSTGSFFDTNIIQSNRDIYADAGFDANTGVTVGTVIGSAPSPVGIANQGYWAANEGTWNQSFSGTIAATSIAADYYCEIVSVGSSPTDFTIIGSPSNAVGTYFVATGPGTGNGTVKPVQGRLYVSNGAAWVLNYTPYTYPYTSAGPPPVAPTLISASTDSTGSSLSLVYSDSCTTGVGGASGFTLSASGGAVTVNLPPTGSGSNTYVYPLSRPIRTGEVVTVSYVQPGNGIESTLDGTDVASFVSQPVTNNSLTSSSYAPELRVFAGIGGGF